MFISFEGIDGVGKSTQIRFAEDYLRSKGKDVLCTLEPGGTELGQEIRNLLLHRKVMLLRGRRHFSTLPTAPITLPPLFGQLWPKAKL